MIQTFGRISGRFFQRSFLASNKTWGKSLASIQISFFSSSEDDIEEEYDLYNPTPEHLELRKMCQTFVTNEVEPQANEHNYNETFNMDLFRKLSELGLFGLTVDEKYGGVNLDATSCLICSEEFSYSGVVVF